MENFMHVESLLPKQKKWELVWNDEFDGEVLDRSKWDFRRNMMHRPHPGWTGDGARLDGRGNLLLTLEKNENGFCSSQLQTGENFMDRPPDAASKNFNWPIAAFSRPKFLHRYGYYEIRCRFQRKPGWWSAFWLQSPNIGSSPDPALCGIEVDIMENFTRDGNFSHNMHWGGYGADHKGKGSGPRFPKEDPEGFHVYGVDWSPDGYVFYVDGEESWRFHDVVSHVEQFLLISTECIGYRSAGTSGKELTDDSIPDCFTVDYVRVYDEIRR